MRLILIAERRKLIPVAPAALLGAAALTAFRSLDPLARD